MRSICSAIFVLTVFTGSCDLNGGVALQSEAGSGADTETTDRGREVPPPDDDRQASPGTESKESSEEPSRDDSYSSFTLGRAFSLQEGGKAACEEGLELTVVSVADSRCPEDVDCVWEGNAEVEIEAAQSGREPTMLTLNTSPRMGTSETYLDYTIELQGLEPYPRTESPPEEPYEATLLVVREER